MSRVVTSAELFEQLRRLIPSIPARAISLTIKMDASGITPEIQVTVPAMSDAGYQLDEHGGLVTETARYSLVHIKPDESEQAAGEAFQPSHIKIVPPSQPVPYPG